MDLKSRMSYATTTTAGQGNLAEGTFRRRTTEILQFTEKTWRWSYLKEQFRLADLEDLYKRYTDKINNGYFSLFLILQCLLSLCHFFVVLVYNMENETLQRVVPDLILYAVAGVVPIVGIFLSESYVKKHPDVLNYASTAAFLLLFSLDVVLPIYHNVQNEDLGKIGIRPTYTTHLVLACHIFFTVRNTSTAMALGIIVSVTHIVVLIFFTYKNSPILIQRIIADSIYYLCINGVGAYFRFINEMMKRRGFLDRRACVQSNLELTFQKDQEEQLMLSIIPKSIIEMVRKDISENFKSMKVQTKPFGNRYIVPHDNVTILYADIVNYTEMTTKLKPVTKLVETLNDLFGSFDDASEALKVLRIKFLGDCYYCVAGLPPDNIPNHADACVDLGLKMIEIIKRVRKSRKLDINMRIGIHSGSILSGIIGIAKWQFDVWSKDVHIANKIESTGSPGKVHITKQTKDQLTKEYNMVPNGRCKTDPFLKQYNIETFLITPEQESEEPSCAKVADIILNPSGLDKRRDTFQRKQDLRKVSSTPNLGRRLTTRGISGKLPLPNIEKNQSINSSEMRTSRMNYRESLISGRMSDRYFLWEDPKRRTGFMDTNIIIYHKMLQLTDDKLSEAIDSMPFAKYDQWIKKSEINPLLLVFKDLKKELNYFQIPDPLFRYYMLTELLILVGVLLIQNITVPHWDCTTFVGFGMMVFVIVILLPLTWSSYIWNSFYHKINNNESVSYVDDSNLSDDPTAEVHIDDKPKNKFILLLYNISNKITINVFYRIIIYLFICALFTVFVFGDLFYCKYGDSSINLLKEKPVNDSTNNCFVPWHMTQTCGLAIVMSFLFLKVHVWIKFFYAATITILYSLFIYQVSDLFEESETLSFQIPTWISHIISIVYLTFTLHLIDRQADYMNRLDHQWNLQLIKEQEEANFMRMINHYLLVNILPVHVAHRYLDVNRTKELYCEEYSDVAVMFASIVNYNLDDTEEKFFMHIMHEIIGDFDKLLVRDSQDKEKNKIEKIKVANWTYMAACGLAPGDSTYSVVDDETRKSYVVTLLSFAVEMRKVLKKHNRESLQDYQLRIGICHGEVTAGVVGSKKPLYDIWGDAVNIASRMDSTGESNRIQVTEETAMAIESSGYKCEFRDFIFVKGKSQKGIPDVPTYWVCLDDEDNLIPICNNEIDEEIS